MCKDNAAKTIISDACSLIRYMKKAGLNFRRKLALKSYCKTRWSTVYIMLKSIVDGYQAIFELLEIRQNSGNSKHRRCLDRIECLKKSTLQKIVNLLKPFKQWIDCLEGETDVTIYQVWPTFIKMNDHLRVSIDCEMEEDSDFHLIEAMKCLGRNYLTKIKLDIEPTVEQRIAVVLNPQMKKLRRMPASERTGVYEEIDRIFINGRLSETASREANRRISGTPFDEFIDSDGEDETSPYSPEFTKYLNHSVSSESSMNLRQWWFQNRTSYPVLFKLFMKISSIPAASSPSERTFSISGAIITDRRSALLPKSVGNIILCRNLYIKCK